MLSLLLLNYFIKLLFQFLLVLKNSDLSVCKLVVLRKRFEKKKNEIYFKFRKKSHQF